MSCTLLPELFELLGTYSNNGNCFLSTEPPLTAQPSMNLMDNYIDPIKSKGEEILITLQSSLGNFTQGNTTVYDSFTSIKTTLGTPGQTGFTDVFGGFSSIQSSVASLATSTSANFQNTQSSVSLVGTNVNSIISTIGTQTDQNYSNELFTYLFELEGKTEDFIDGKVSSLLGVLGLNYGSGSTNNVYDDFSTLKNIINVSGYLNDGQYNTIYDHLTEILDTADDIKTITGYTVGSGHTISSHLYEIAASLGNVVGQTTVTGITERLLFGDDGVGSYSQTGLTKKTYDDVDSMLAHAIDDESSLSNSDFKSVRVQLEETIDNILMNDVHSVTHQLWGPSKGYDEEVGAIYTILKSDGDSVFNQLTIRQTNILGQYNGNEEYSIKDQLWGSSVSTENGSPSSLGAVNKIVREILDNYEGTGSAEYKDNNIVSQIVRQNTYLLGSTSNDGEYKELNVAQQLYLQTGDIELYMDQKFEALREDLHALSGRSRGHLEGISLGALVLIVINVFFMVYTMLKINGFFDVKYKPTAKDVPDIVNLEVN